METAILLSAAYGWFAGLLVVMIVVTALFALILWIALKPIKKDELDDSSSAKKALGRRETELTIELLNKQHSEKERAQLETELREVKSAERLVGELMPEEDAAGNNNKPANAAKAPRRAAAPAQPPKGERAPAGARPAQPARPVNRAQNPAEARPARPAQSEASAKPNEAGSKPNEAGVKPNDKN